ncbi:TolB protein [Desulfonauticus submarinus]|uniref:TolB protein n=1 Tax=Desulfonauticus submarinus TaxID=206665 RepID=A0A1G9ZJK1_9BACT|nr:PD40 domain-containing protein [Desulfonauticus submarinus]SDN21221.1 TolB protein [Desulfonauticus submarinus]
MIKRKNFIFYLFCFYLFIFNNVYAKSLKISIYGPAQHKVNIFVADPVILNKSGVISNEIAKLKLSFISKLKLFPFLNIVKKENVLDKGKIQYIDLPKLDLKKFFLSQVDILITIGINFKENTLGRVELRAFDVFQRKMFLGQAFELENSQQIELVVRQFSAALLKQFIGKDAFFKNPIVFVSKSKNSSSIYQVFADGFGLKRLFEVKGIAVSPCWSFDGRKIVFSVIQDRRHKLGVFDLDTQKINYKKLPGNTCISPVFTPFGDIAVSLDLNGNPDIYLLDKNFKIKKTLVEHWGIDISPFFDKQGDKMVFTSSRLGNPHIFLWQKNGEEIKRITYDGKYNTSAVISPDGRLVVFSRLTPTGHRIFVYDLLYDIEKQITFGPGNDEEPFVSLDGYFVVFVSNRDGKYKLYYTTINGDGPYLIPTKGIEVFSPAWSWVKAH